MIASPPPPSKPCSRNIRDAVSTIRWRFSAACSRLTRICPSLPLCRTPLTGYMTSLIYQNKCRSSSIIRNARRPRVSNSARDAVLAIAASSGNGTNYADRLARRGYDLVHAPRNKDRLETNCPQLRSEAGVALEVGRGGLTVTVNPARLETRRRQNGSVSLLVNDAGGPLPRGFAELGKSVLPPVFARERKQPMPRRIWL